MSRAKAWLLVVGIVLVGLAPFSSTRPDAVQRLLGSPGGAGSVLKAAFGLVAAGLVAMGVGVLLRRRGPRS